MSDFLGDIPIVADPGVPPGVLEMRSGESFIRAFADPALRENIAAQVRERLAAVSRCPQCGHSATGAEWDLLRHAQAMNAALSVIRSMAETQAAVPGWSAAVLPVDAVLRVLDEPYRFPLPGTPQ